MKATAEKKADESKYSGEWMDVDYLDIARDTGGGSSGVSDVKFDDAMLEFIDSVWKEY